LRGLILLCMGFHFLSWIFFALDEAQQLATLHFMCTPRLHPSCHTSCRFIPHLMSHVIIHISRLIADNSRFCNPCAALAIKLHVIVTRHVMSCHTSFHVMLSGPSPTTGYAAIHVRHSPAKEADDQGRLEGATERLVPQDRRPNGR
jgi:hypothetical protein